MRNSSSPPPKRSTPQRTHSSSSRGKQRGGDGSVENNKAAVAKLQAKLNEMEVKRREELYWLKLELDTTRREKEAVEDRLAELYRDTQELVEQQDSSGGTPGGVGGRRLKGAGDGENAQKQLQKYEKMVRIMNNQIQLVRSSSDKVVKSLKEEISDLMDDKSRSEVQLMNQLTDLEKQNREMAARLEIAGQQQQVAPKTLAGTSLPGRLPPSSSLTGLASPAQVKELKAEAERLKAANAKLSENLDNEKRRARDAVQQLEKEKDELSAQVDKLQNELLVAKSSSEAVRALDQMRTDREESTVALDRVAMIWNQADESIKDLEAVMAEFTPTEDRMDNDREQMLSTLETASLVHGQVKVSLMLIELKLRNNVACLRNDRAQLGAAATSDEVFANRLKTAQDEAMEAIERVSSALTEQMLKLEEHSANETKIVKETLQSKVVDLERMQSRQKFLEDEITKLHESGATLSLPGVGLEDESDMFVSREVLEQLQNEVIQIVQRLNEKNEIIGRLTATTEEHKVRERALKEELKRLLHEQAEAQATERQRRMDAQALRDGDNDSEATDEDYEDYSSDEYIERSVLEETVIEESVMDEETVIEEEVIEEDEEEA